MNAPANAPTAPLADRDDRPVAMRELKGFLEEEAEKLEARKALVIQRELAVQRHLGTYPFQVTLARDFFVARSLPPRGESEYERIKELVDLFEMIQDPSARRQLLTWFGPNARKANPAWVSPVWVQDPRM